jgi:hypothetical protein
MPVNNPSGSSGISTAHTAGVTLANSAGTITTNSTSLVAATNVSKAITITGDSANVLVIASFCVYHDTDATQITLQLLFNSVEIGRMAIQSEGTSANRTSVQLVGMATGVASGSKTAEVYWKTDAGNVTMDQSGSNGSASIVAIELI